MPDYTPFRLRTPDSDAFKRGLDLKRKTAYSNKTEKDSYETALRDVPVCPRPASVSGWLAWQVYGDFRVDSTSDTPTYVLRYITFYPYNGGYVPDDWPS